MNEIVITVAGRVGAGKSELVRTIQQHLENLGITAHVHTEEVPNQIDLLRNGTIELDVLKTRTKVILQTASLAKMEERV